MRPPKPWFWAARKGWYVKLDGKQIKLSDDKKLAELAFHRLMADRGEAKPLKNVTLADVFDAFLESVNKHHPKSLEWYRSFLQDFANGRQKMLAGEVTEMMVRDWVTGPHPRPWGQSTQRSAITVIKRALNWCIEAKLLAENPIRHMKRPSAVARDRILTEQERVEILSWYPDGDPFRDFLVALMESGCRPGEVMKVEAKDVDLDGETWTVHGKTTDRTGKKRVIYMTPELSALTARLCERNPTGPIFLNEDGNPWNRQAVNCRFRRKRKSKGLPKDVTAYVYRGTWATDALVNGVSDATVAELMGHKGTATLHKHYAKLAEKKGHLKEAARQAVKKPT